MSRFVRPESRVLRLATGETLTVRRYLNVGEVRGIFARVEVKHADPADDLDLTRAIVAAYLIDWTVTDDSGAIVPIRDADFSVVMSALNAMFNDDFLEIKEAIDAHVAEQADARAQEKKLRTGTSAFSATSASPVAAAGAMNG